MDARSFAWRVSLALTALALAACGGGVVISRIDELTPDSYRETEVRRRDGREFGRYAGGTHHVSFTRDMVVVDGKHVYRDPRKLAWAAGRLRRKIGALVTRRTAAEPSPA